MVPNVSLHARLAGRRDHLVPHRHNKQRQQCHRNSIVKRYSRGQAMRDISINEILHSKGLFDFMGLWLWKFDIRYSAFWY